MSVPAEVIKGCDATRLAAALKKATTYVAHDKISLVHIPSNVVAVIAKKYASGDKAKDFERQEYEASSTATVRLIKYARKIHEKIIAFLIDNSGVRPDAGDPASACLVGYGCQTNASQAQILSGLVRNKSDMMLYVRGKAGGGTQITAIIAWGRAGTGKYGRKIVLQTAPIPRGPGQVAKKERIYKLYRHKRLAEVDLLQGDKYGTDDAVKLFQYVIAHYIVGHASGVVVQGVVGKFGATLATQHGFKKVESYLKVDNEYKPLFPAEVSYYALVDTPKCDDDKGKCWAAKFAAAFNDNTHDLCLGGKQGYKAAQLCTF
jgi:hypothetical protein